MLYVLEPPDSSQQVGSWLLGRQWAYSPPGRSGMLRRYAIKVQRPDADLESIYGSLHSCAHTGIGMLRLREHLGYAL